MAAIENDWLPALEPEFHKDYYRKLYLRMKEEYHKYVIYPPSEEIFNAFHLTPLSKVKVVILGQDPYHGPNQAHGLAFSVKEGVKLPPSLQNIYKEISSEYGYNMSKNGYLVPWAKQGVLLLNSSLTAIAEKAGAHNKFWYPFTRDLMEYISTKNKDKQTDVASSKGVARFMTVVFKD